MTVFIIQNTIIYTIPLLIVALGGMFAERSGVINLALEGEMIFGAFMGAVAVYGFQMSATTYVYNRNDYRGGKRRGVFAAVVILGNKPESRPNYRRYGTQYACPRNRLYNGTCVFQSRKTRYAQVYKLRHHQRQY